MIKRTLIESGMTEEEANAVLAEQMKLVQDAQVQKVVQRTEVNMVPENKLVEQEQQPQQKLQIFSVANVIEDYFEKPQTVQKTSAQRSAELRAKMESTNAKMQQVANHIDQIAPQ